MKGRKNTISVYYICNYAHIGMCKWYIKDRGGQNQSRRQQKKMQLFQLSRLRQKQLMIIHIWQRVMPMFIRTVIIQIRQMKYYRLIFIRRLMFLMKKVNPNASPAVFFDTYGHAVVPFQGGLAIRDINADETQTEGYFSPAKHDGGGYVIQSSYSFVDESNRLVCPTSNNHVLMLKATDDAGNVLPEFEKVLDIDIKAAAEEITGKTLDQNLLSVVFDYEGNLWFATGGFRIYPERKQQGAMGYISRAAIDAILKGEHVDLKESTFVYELEPGEGAENGIASSKEGAVILTNQNCYLLNAKRWCTGAVVYPI